MKNYHYTSVLFLTLLFLINSCASLPERVEVTPQQPPPAAIDLKLSTIFSRAVADNGDNTGFILLKEGERALLERIKLAETAENSIDAQYFIWNSDKSGRLLFNKLAQAADRGVKVRLLLDDFNVGDRSERLLAVNSHPNIQLRVYNPFVTRSGVGKWVNMAADFSRLNRRMHNKTYIVDGTAAIVGGRNIGDEYFDQDEHINFIDLDLLTIGPAVKQVSASFNDYWNAPWAIPIDQLIKDKAAEYDYEYLQQQLKEIRKDQAWLSSTVLDKPGEVHFQEILEDFIWAPAVFIQDQPVSDEENSETDEVKAVARKLLQLAENSEKEIIIESAYFVLDKDATQLARELTDKGVKIRALTNSMASNDVLPNHASYAMVRRPMLNSGIELYELRPDADSCLQLIGKPEYCDEDSFISLHSKAAVFDRKTVYVGSLNLNLRSAYLNTEVGMFIESPALAEQLKEQIEINMQHQNSWQAVIENSELQWITIIDGESQRTDIEPQTSWLQRFKAGVLTLLPGAKYY